MTAPASEVVFVDPALQVAPHSRSVAWTALLVGILAFGLYAWTLAPTVLWADEAEFQRVSWTGDLLDPPRGHLLWVWAARLFSYVPLGEPALRANLVTALFGAAGAAVAACCVWSIGGDRFGMLIGGGALALAHTYWIHAVRAEVYTLHCLLLGFALLLCSRWSGTPDRVAYAFWSTFICGVATLNHAIILLALPPIGLMVLLGPPKWRWRALGAAAAGFVAGVIPFLLFSAARIAEKEGQWELVDPSTITPRRLGLTVLFYVYQFPALLPLAIPGLLGRKGSRAPMTALLACQIVLTALFVMSFNAKDQYVFHLPAYVCVAMLIGRGASRVCVTRPWLRWAVSAGLLLSPIVYLAAARASERFEVLRMDARSLPGRGADYFIWPSKRGYEGARSFASAALEVVQPRSLILADWTMSQPILYLQEVEGRRRDVEVVIASMGWPEQTEFLVKRSGYQPIYTAALDLYYRRSELERLFDIEPAGPIFHLKRRPANLPAAATGHHGRRLRQGSTSIDTAQTMP